MSLHPAPLSILYADRRRNILLVPVSKIDDLQIIAEDAGYPTIIVCPDDIDNPHRAMGFIAGYLQGSARKATT